MVYFPAPNANERLSLWQKTMPASIKPAPDVQLSDLANKYEITGAAVLNAVHFATLRSISEKNSLIQLKDIIEGIRRELRKEERTMH
jgi:ATP-dependent 26S proteasome regulatory subunit